MHALLWALAGAAGGAFVVNATEAARQRRITDDLARQAALDLSAKELVNGRTYAVTFMIDPRAPGWGGIKDVTQGASLVKATMEAPGGTGGWLLKAPAAPIDEANRRLFIAGQPSQWAFTGLWTLPQKFVAQRPDWMTMAVPFLLPTG